MDPPPSTAKLRLMCSYGGQILPRPRTNTLFYAGGDTRIVSIDRHTITTLSALISHLSSVLSLNFSFTLKYQLPHLDLDSLISLASDEDFQILLDEHRRSSSTRIRLFVFPSPLIRHPKTESWFFDALKSTKLMQNGVVVDAPDPPPESTLLDTTSSFGSTSSSASLTNLPPIRLHTDDHDAVFNLTSSDSIPSDNTVSNMNISYQDPVVHVPEVESKIPYITNNANMDIGYTSFPQFNPNVQFVQAPTPTQFFPLHTLKPLPSGHNIYHQNQTRPLHHPVYHPDQFSPVYLVPVGNMPPNNFPITATSQPSINFHLPQNYARGFTTSTREPQVDAFPMHHHHQSQCQSQNVSVASGESPQHRNEIDNDLAHVHIYKSQPPPPALPSKYQTMTKASTDLLSEALARLHVDNFKPQTETSQPQ